MDKDMIVKHKFFIVDIEKEQKFIDSYREKGYELAYVNKSAFKYVFRKSSNPFIPRVRIDYRTFEREDDYQDYITLYEDAGWKHISGSRTSYIHYFQQMHTNTTDELFSDKQSYAELYKRLFTFSMFNISIILVFIFATTKAYNPLRWLHPKELFLTPGLWELSGFRFVRAFLFELPFVFFRNGWPFLFFIALIIFIVCAVKAKKKEKKYRSITPIK